MNETEIKTAITALRIKLPESRDHVAVDDDDVEFDYETWNVGVSTAVQEVFPDAAEVNFDEWTGTYDLGGGDRLVITDNTGYLIESELLGLDAWDVDLTTGGEV